MENKPLMIGVVVVLVAVGIVAVAVSKQNTAKRVASEQQAMEQKAMEEKAIMEKEKMANEEATMKDQEKDKMMMEDSKKEDVMVKDVMQKESPSTYVDYSSQVLGSAETAQKSGRKVVLFFHAPWCPYCISADKDFKANIGTDKFPANVTLIKTDYDSQSELKKKYGVTHQHTFVQIDSNGNQITKWVSGETSELKTNIQ